MSSLTEDEVTVLMLAAKGESMIAMARWEKPINDLVARGLMQRLNKANNIITLAGQQALQIYEKEIDDDLKQALTGNNKVANAHTQAMLSAEAAAAQLVLAARASLESTGDSLEIAIRRWSETVLRRAFELAK